MAETDLETQGDGQRMALSEAILLARIDERTRQTSRDINGMSERLDSHIKATSESLNALEKRYVSKEEFRPVRNIVYGAVSIILVAVFGALVALVVARGFR